MRNRLEKCLQMQERAKERIPGMTQLLSKRPDMFSEGVWPAYFSKAKGAEVWDLDGNKYIDMSIAGIGANVLGYCDPDVDAAVKDAIAKGTSCSLNCPEEVELAELLCELHPWAEMVRFARTGGEAMAIAVRIARAHTGKDKVAFCGYHGWHDWYLSANLGTENALGDHLISGLSPRGVPKGLVGTTFPFSYNRSDQLEDIISKHGKELAAVIIEPIRNIEPVSDFLYAIRSLAEEGGAMLVFDEISAGFRLTTGGSHLALKSPSPDIAVFSKALGNGYPIAAVIGTARVMQAAQDTFISSTYWTERIGPTAAVATITKHRRLQVARHLIRLGEQVQKGWRDFAAKHDLELEVNGIKPLSHFHFLGNMAQTMKSYFIQLMLERGFLTSNIYYAMLPHTQEHVRAYLLEVDQAFGEIKRAVKNGELEQKLAGKPAATGFQRLT